jgi:transcriptional regulator with XRE-family HTH domain
MDTLKIGNKIAELRKLKGAKQEELAAAVGVSPQAVSKWETVGNPDVELLPAIADFFGVSVDELFGRAAAPGNYTYAVMREIESRPREERLNAVFEICVWMHSILELSAVMTPEVLALAKTMTDSFLPLVDMMKSVQPALTQQTYSRTEDSRGTIRVAHPAPSPDTARLGYFFLMPTPEGGFSGTFAKIGEYLKLFAALGDENTLRALFLLDSRELGHVTPQLFEKQLGLPPEAASDAAAKLFSLDLLARSTLELNGETVDSYVYRRNTALYAVLALAKELIARPQVLLPFTSDPAVSADLGALDVRLE